MRDDDLDPAFLLWSMHVRMDVARDLRTEIRAGRIELIGPSALRKQFPDWVQLSSLAPFPRRRPGREQRLDWAHRANGNLL
ncbi:MAG TPA: hypothetical protein VH542_04760 [Steroidobacteraceae bacterium]